LNKARTLDFVYERCTGLPLGLHIQQDNTSREGKNQFILRFAAMMVLLKIFRWVTLGFLRMGHTHDNLDQIFAQVVTAIRHSIFDTPDNVVEVLERLCRRSKEIGSQLQSEAARLGETACWKAWGDRVGVTFSGHTMKGLL
jgi:hypothetical protein